jgi:ABC-type multidrug transport system fused ATPase/permease subunit
MAYMNKLVFNAIEYQEIQLFYKSVVMGVVIILVSYLYPYTRYLHIKMVRVMVYDMKLKMYKHLMKLPMDYYDTHHSGDAIQRVGNDAESLKTAYFTQVYVLINLVVCGVSALINMFIYSIEIAVVSIIFTSINIYLVSFCEKKVNLLSKEIQHKIGRLTEKISSILGGLIPIRVYRGSKIILDDFEAFNDSLCEDITQRGNKLAILQLIASLCGILGNLGTIIIGVWFVALGRIELGTVMAIVSLQISVGNMIQRLSWAIARLNMSVIKSERIFEFLDIPVEEPQRPTNILEREPAAVEFSNVTFGYTTENNILDQYNRIIQAGEKVVVVGESGCGKSTLVKLILRFYKPSVGSIKVFGNENSRSLVSYVSQDSYLFEGTIKENIRYGRLDAGDEEIYEAARLSHADDFIREKEDGYDTVLRLNGENLSGGQRQRIALARALLKDAPIILLDEATSALDSTSERSIMEAIERYRGKKTILMITHRLKTTGSYDALITFPVKY